MISVCSVIHTKLVSTFCGLKVDLVKEKSVSKYSNNSALNCYAELYIRIIRIPTLCMTIVLFVISTLKFTILNKNCRGFLQSLHAHSGTLLDDRLHTFHFTSFKIHELFQHVRLQSVR